MKKQYTLEARAYPAIIALLPLIVVYLFITETYANGIMKFLSFSIFGIGVGIVLYDQLMELVRAISKKFEFSQNDMPTTKYILDILKKDKNNILLTTIQKNEGINLYENSNVENIKLVVSKIISKLRDNDLVFQHNIEYGKARNMVGASLLGLIFTLILIILIYVSDSILKIKVIVPASINTVYTFLVILLIVYIVSFFFYKNEFKKRGEDYARILFREYLGTGSK